MGEYQHTRDVHVRPFYDFTCKLATLEPPPPELQQMLGRRAREPGGDGWLCTPERRHDIADGIFCTG